MVENIQRLQQIEKAVSNIVDFSMLHTAIMRESALLHPSLATMQESYLTGLGVAHTVENDGQNVAVGYARVIPLLSFEQREQLSLPGNFPDVYELGTVIVHPDYRGRGISEQLQRELIRRFKGRLDEESLLILGTTKTRKVLHILDKLSDEGVSFYHCRHTEFPHIAPLTCICSPYFGEGFQHTTDCSKRVTEPQVIFIRQILTKTSRELNIQTDKIPCTMFISDKELAERMDATLADLYGGGNFAQERFVNRLKEIRYFDE